MGVAWMAQLAGPAGSREPGLPGSALDSALPTWGSREGHRLYQAALRAPRRQQDHKDPFTGPGPARRYGGLSTDVCAARWGAGKKLPG